MNFVKINFCLAKVAGKKMIREDTKENTQNTYIKGLTTPGCMRIIFKTKQSNCF